jgi:hypothetical protein
MSYGTVVEVEALTRHLLDGEAGYSETTTPTRADVESIMDRVSGVLNTALAAEGFSVPLSDATAVQACAQFVVRHTVKELRWAYPHLGVGGEEATAENDLFMQAGYFAAANKLAFKNLGETVSDSAGQGLSFTGLLKHSERSDPLNKTFEQPKFTRGQFES